MESSLSILVITFLKVFIKLNVNMEIIVKNVKRVELNKKIVNPAVDLIEYKYLCCNKNYQKRLDKILKKKFVNTYKFSKSCLPV